MVAGAIHFLVAATATFLLLKVGILALEIYFFYNIVNSLVKAIHCPDKPGFQLGEGYLPWASDYSSTCFTRRMLLYYQIPFLQTVQQLVAEISRYHLADFIRIDLSSKYLSPMMRNRLSMQSSPKEPIYSYLDLGNNPLNNLPLRFFSDLSQLQYLYLSFSTTTIRCPHTLTYHIYHWEHFLG